MPSPLLTALAVLSLTATPPAATATPRATGDDRVTLEELLESYRAQRDARLEALREEVDALLRQLELAIDAGGASEVGALRDRLVKLGPDAAPILARQIDPGANSEVEAVRRRAMEVSRVLTELDTTAITDELLRIVEQGTTLGKRNALRVLGSTAEGDRVSPILRRLFAVEGGPPRDALLGAIASIGGPQNDAFVADSLDPADKDLARIALQALTTARCTSSASQVGALLADSKAASNFAVQLVGYYRACPEAVDDEVCQAFLALLAYQNYPTDLGVLYVGLLADFEDEWSRDVKRTIETLSLRTGPLGTEARVALARAGDRAAKRDLLEPLDRDLDENDELARNWAARAEMHFRLQDYKQATKDYVKALAAPMQSPTDRRVEWQESLARAYARLGKVREASQWIEKSLIPAERRKELAVDPDFKEVAEHARYGKVFDIGS